MKPIITLRGHSRKGKGFSTTELREVKLSLKDALHMKLPVDTRRKTLYKENVVQLKKLLT